MKKYELVVVFDPRLGESVLQEETKKLKEFIGVSGGQSVSADVWGRKDLAYRVKSQMAGYFVVFNFACERGDVIDALTGRLRIADGVFKFQTHRKIERRKKFPERRRSSYGMTAAEMEAAEADF